MRGTQCHRDTMKVAGRQRPTRRRMLFLFVKKMFRIKSPSIMAISVYDYEYDYFKDKYFWNRFYRYFGGIKSGQSRVEKKEKGRTEK